MSTKSTQTLDENAKPIHTPKKGKKAKVSVNVHDSIDFRNELTQFIQNARVKKESEALEKRLRGNLTSFLDQDDRALIKDKETGLKKLIVELDDVTRVLITESIRAGNVNWNHPEIQKRLEGLDLEQYRNEGTRSYTFRETDKYEV